MHAPETPKRKIDWKIFFFERRKNTRAGKTQNKNKKKKNKKKRKFFEINAT